MIFSLVYITPKIQNIKEYAARLMEVLVLLIALRYADNNSKSREDRFLIAVGANKKFRRFTLFMP